MSVQTIEDCSFLEISSISSHFVLEDGIEGPLRLILH